MVGITKHHGARRALGPIDLTVHPGETLAVLGPNGSGKSTLLGIAACLADPTKGSRHVFGLDPGREPEAAKRRLGVLSQDAPVYDELTPRQHLVWSARLRDLDGARLVDPLLASAGLTRLAYRPCSELSRGERQRTALAMALLGEPDLLILDEPFAALDAQGQSWLEHVLATRRRERPAAGTLVAVHDASQASRIAHRTLTLSHGRPA